MTLGLQVYETDVEDYRRLVDGSKWTVAALGHSERFDPRTPIRLERHLLTDETFVLLSGSATLILGESCERIPMERGKVYNITAGTWHHIQVEPGTQVLVIEDSDTSKANTERKPI